MEQQKKRNDLLLVYVEDDMVYAQPKKNMSRKEIHILLGILDDFIKFLSEKPKKTKGKQKWLN